jgi:hypothetical protein
MKGFIALTGRCTDEKKAIEMLIFFGIILLAVHSHLRNPAVVFEKKRIQKKCYRN